MAATMKDIARRTGLGLATISSYFNGGNVREKNRIKIEEAIEELHYEVNEVARGLKTNATKTSSFTAAIAVLPYAFGSMVSGFSVRSSFTALEYAARSSVAKFTLQIPRFTQIHRKQKNS